MKVKIGNSNINYEVKGEGRTAIFFSGFENDMTAMIKSLEPIFESKQNWKRIYVDHIGVGDTEIGNDVDSVEDVLNTMLAFVDEIVGTENFVLGGYSFGGFLSRYIIGKRFDQVDGVLLLTPLIKNDMMNIDVDRNVQTIKYVDSTIQGEIDRRIQEDLVGAMQKTNMDFMMGLYEKNLNTKVELDKFNGVFNKPTLIITGRQDETVGYKDAFSILDKYPRATYITLDKCGHAAQFQQVDIYKQLITEWIYRLEEEQSR
ncbi:MAG: alpha/beta hydrolase [Firmicutes bacterium]|jgi:pimeloyl-ACP methyl ester carboxylesterase|nr:alpha/beta hydrolase [Bacillota bacterium]